MCTFKVQLLTIRPVPVTSSPIAYCWQYKFKHVTLYCNPSGIMELMSEHVHNILYNFERKQMRASLSNFWDRLFRTMLCQMPLQNWRRGKSARNKDRSRQMTTSKTAENTIWKLIKDSWLTNVDSDAKDSPPPTKNTRTGMMWDTSAIWAWHHTVTCSKIWTYQLGLKQNKKPFALSPATLPLTKTKRREVWERRWHLSFQQVFNYHHIWNSTYHYCIT